MATHIACIFFAFVTDTYFRDKIYRIKNKIYRIHLVNPENIM